MSKATQVKSEETAAAKTVPLEDFIRMWFLQARHPRWPKGLKPDRLVGEMTRAAIDAFLDHWNLMK